jgi:hypothetical protein
MSTKEDTTTDESEDDVPLYNPPYLLNNPRIQLQINGLFTKTSQVRHVGRLTKSSHISYSHTYVTEKRKPLKFIFVNIQSGLSEFGTCNVVVVDAITEEYLGVMYNSKAGYLKIDSTQTLGVHAFKPLPEPYLLEMIPVTTKESDGSVNSNSSEEEDLLQQQYIRGGSNLLIGMRLKSDVYLYDLIKRVRVGAPIGMGYEFNLMVLHEKNQIKCFVMKALASSEKQKNVNYFICCDEKRSIMLELQMNQMKIEKVAMQQRMEQQQLSATEERKQQEIKMTVVTDREKKNVAVLEQKIKLLEKNMNEKIKEENTCKKHALEKSVLKKEVLRQRRESDVQETEIKQLKNQVSMLSSRVNVTEKKLMTPLEDLNVANKRVVEEILLREGGEGSSDSNTLQVLRNRVVHSQTDLVLSTGLLNVSGENNASENCNTCLVQ